MKQLLLLLTLPLLIIACGDTTEAIPEDLAGKKALLSEKRAALKALQAEINDLEAQVEELDPKPESRTLVTTAPVKKARFDHYVEIQGTVQTDDFVNVSSEMGGRILELKVDEGDNVRKGQLIARLDLEQLEKQIAEVQTSLDLAQEVYERQKRLWDQNIGSEIQFLQAKNNKERLEKSLETLNVQLGKSKVYAPISGVVERVMLKAGEMASPGMPLIQILNTNQVKVVASVPENYLKAVRKGDRVTVKFPALDEERQAPVTLVGRTIDPSNRTFNVEVDLGNSSGQLKPNLLATMLINDFSEDDAITLPIELIQQEVGGKNYVYVVGDSEEGTRAKKVYVKTGKSYEGEIIITEGLQGTEQLIIDGARAISNNDLLKIKTTNPSTSEKG
jgi:RND family efflux transporter MFP subunit